MRSPRVLIVEDNVMNAELATYVLQADGYAVEAVHESIHALEQVRAFDPDLVLMDIQMPGTDGLTLTRMLKASPETRHIVVIAFTAFATKRDEDRVLAAGCDGHISKPIDVVTFSARMRSYLSDSARK